MTLWWNMAASIEFYSLEIETLKAPLVYVCLNFGLISEQTFTQMLRGLLNKGAQLKTPLNSSPGR